MTSRAPVYILNQNSQREQGKKAQAANIKAAKVTTFPFLTYFRLFQTLSGLLWDPNLC